MTESRCELVKLMTSNFVPDTVQTLLRGSRIKLEERDRFASFIGVRKT